MALSTASNEICSSVARRHFQPGMEELVSFAQSLIEARTDLSATHQMRRHIARASQEMGEALEELQGGLSTIDAKSVQLVAQKNSLQWESHTNTQKLSNLRYQLDSHRDEERRSREMLETAQRHLRAMQQQLSEKEREVEHNQQIRNVGLGLLFIPFVGPIVGGAIAICAQVSVDQAQSEKRAAEEEVSRHSENVDQLSAKTKRIHSLIQEAEESIWITRNRLSSIEAEKHQLASQQAEVVRFQNTLRKCVTFLAMLAGKVDTAELLSRDVVIYNELEMVLEEILNHVFPLMGQGRESCAMALSTSEIRALIQRLKSAREKLSLEGPGPGWGNVAIDF